MIPARQGFMHGYMLKKAGPITTTSAGVVGGLSSATLGALAEAVSKMGPVVLAAPLIAGAGVGYGVSRMTSPNKMDAEAMQSALELAELQEMETGIRRRSELDKLQKKRGVTGERSLRV
jgi:hypothetical protein